MQDTSTAVVVFYNTEQKVLMHKRSSLPEEWAFVGGSIEPGESPQQAALREIKEELGYEIRDLFFLKNYVLAPGKGTPHAIYTYLATFPGFDQFHETEEGDIRNDLYLVTLKEAEKLPSFPIAYEIMKDVTEYFAKKS